MLINLQHFHYGEYDIFMSHPLEMSSFSMASGTKLVKFATEKSEVSEIGIKFMSTMKLLIYTMRTLMRIS